VIHLWLQRASALPDHPTATWLSNAEVVRADSFRSARARLRYQTSHAWLHECLAALLGVAPVDVPVHIDRSGAPSLEGAALQLSLSHHGDWLALAASTSEPVGVDVLTIPPDADFVDDTALVLSPEEISLVKGCPDEHQAGALAECWVRKEAYAKMRRTGLTAELACLTLTPRAQVPGTSLWSRQVSDAVVALAVACPVSPEIVVHERQPVPHRCLSRRSGAEERGAGT
jgi:4'-phosphopantetheinyl transferase